MAELGAGVVASSSTKGFRRMRSGNFQVRVAGFPPEVFADELTATLRVAELRIAKREGHALPTPAVTHFCTLGQAADAFLAHKLAQGGRYGELTPAGASHWRLATRPWREG